MAAAHGRAVVLLDEAHLLPNWAAGLKGEWDRLRRAKIPVNVVASGSSALRMTAGSRESLAGRFERVTLTHWSASSLANVFSITSDFRGLTEFTRRDARFRALVLCDEGSRAAVGRLGLEAMTWADFLLAGPPRSV